MLKTNDFSVQTWKNNSIFIDEKTDFLTHFNVFFY